jgi:hypothetical protein
MFLFWAKSIQPMTPHSTSQRSILISSSHLHLRLQSDVFFTGFPTKTLNVSLLCPTRATSLADLILLDWITWLIFGEEYRLSPSLCSFLHSPVTSSLLSPNNFSASYSQKRSAYVPPSMTDHFSHPYKWKGKFVVLYILIFIFLEQTWRQKFLHRMIASIPWLQSALNFIMNGTLIRSGRSQISELFHSFEGFFIIPYIVTSSCSLVSLLLLTSSYCTTGLCNSQQCALRNSKHKMSAFLRKLPVDVISRQSERWPCHKLRQI